MISFLLSLLIPLPAQAQNCVPARETVLFPHRGQYHRVHPSGQYVIYSTGGRAKIVDLRERGPDGKIRAREIVTRMSDEAAAVEPRWDLIASPYDIKNNKSTMSYYSFDKMINSNDPMNVESDYDDQEHNEFYHSSAEMPDSTKNKRHVRTMLYTENRAREYTFHMDNSGHLTKAEPGKPFKLCDNIINPKQDADSEKKFAALQTSLAKVSAKSQQMALELKREFGLNRDGYCRRCSPYFSSGDSGSSSRGQGNNIYDEMMVANEIPALEGQSDVPQSTSKKMSELVKTASEREQIRLKMEEIKPGGISFPTPVLSKDGTHVATNWGGTLKVYKINPDKSCTLAHDAGVPTPKPSFSYPEAGKEPKLVFASEGGAPNGMRRGIVIFDPNKAGSARSQFIALDPRGNGYYPGFTNDGRLIVPTNEGLQIIDPNQLPGGSGRCVENVDNRPRAPKPATVR